MILALIVGGQAPDGASPRHYWILICSLTLCLALPAAAQQRGVFGERGPGRQIESRLDNLRGRSAVSGFAGAAAPGERSAVLSPVGASAFQSAPGIPLPPSDQTGFSAGSVDSGGPPPPPGKSKSRSQPAVRSPVRPAYRVRFSRRTLGPARVRDGLQQRLDRLASAYRHQMDVAVTLTGSQVTLRGSVGSEPLKQLVETLVRLEPGVYAVENRLRVAAIQ